MAKQKTLVSAEIAKEAANRIVENTSTLRAIEASIDDRINEIRQQYAAQIKTLQETVSVDEKTVTSYVNQNPDVFPNGKKTVEWGALIISKRITPPKVGIPSGTDWTDAIEALKSNKMGGFIRTVEEVNKDLIIASVAIEGKGDEIRAELSKIGITVTQKEKVNLEVKSEDIV